MFDTLKCGFLPFSVKIVPSEQMPSRQDSTEITQSISAMAV